MYSNTGKRLTLVTLRYSKVKGQANTILCMDNYLIALVTFDLYLNNIKGQKVEGQKLLNQHMTIVT